MRISYLVILDQPEDVDTKTMEAYIEDAVSTMKGSYDPETPLFNLDGDSVCCIAFQRVEP